MALVQFSESSFRLPAFAAQQFTPDRLMPGGARIVASQFPFSDAAVVTLAAGAVTAGSNRTLALTAALPQDIPAGYILDFGAGEFATLTNGAVKGATSITGVTLAADLEGGESATFAGTSGKKPIAAGTLVGRTYTERDAGTGFGVADVATPDDEIYLLAFMVEDAVIKPDCTLLRHGTLIYENQLPGWATMTAPQRAAIRSRYNCIRAAY